MKQEYPIGFGTYRISVKNTAHVDAITYALGKGIRLIDTSTNYAAGDAERAIAAAIRQSGVARDSLHIVSKAGYIQGPMLESVKRGELEVFDLVPYQEGCYHSIHSDFILSQLRESLQRLETGYIDTYLLHNPEYFLMHAIDEAGEQEQIVAARQEMERRILEAFIALEEAAAEGMIRGYGISSNGFSKSPDSPHFMPYDNLMALAREAAAEAGNSEPHLTTLQMPLNMLETEGLACAKWAKQEGLKVMANRPLNAFDSKGMHRLANYEAPSDYEEKKEALLRAADTFSMSELRTAITDLDTIRPKFSWPGAAEEALVRHTIPFLQGILSRMPNQEAKSAVIPLLNPFLQSWLQSVSHACGEKELRYLESLEFQEASHPLQHTAISWLLQRPEVDTVLLGMRKRDYVDDALQVIENLKKA